MANFWAISNNTPFMKKMIWLLFGQYWEKSVNSLFDNLVTLVAIEPPLASSPLAEQGTNAAKLNLHKTQQKAVV